MHIGMEITHVQNSESIEGRRQARDGDLVIANLDIQGVTPASPVETGYPQHESDKGVDGVPVFRVEEIDTLSEYLRIVLRLDAQSLARMHRSEPSLDNADNIQLLRRRIRVRRSELWRI
jgi:hypothetical protein